MKYLRTTVLVIAGISIIAGVVNTHSARPTALCQSEPSEGVCKSSQDFFYGEASNIAFETTAGTVVCTEGVVEAETTEPPTLKGTALKATYLPEVFASCFLGGVTFCAVKSINTNYLATITWTSGSNGEVELGNGGAGPPRVQISCAKGIDCTYTFESPLELKGGGGASLVASKDKLGSASGSICPGSGAAITWSAKYFLSTVYVANYVTSVALCKKNEAPCPGEETFGTGTAMTAGLEAGVKAKLKLSIKEESEETGYAVSCEVSVIEGKTTASSGWPLPGEVNSITFGECGPTCSVKALKLSYKSQIEATGSGNGTIALVAGSGAPRIRVRCIGAYKCTYESSSVSTSVSGGTPAKLAVSATLATKVVAESDEKCGPQLKWEGNYRFTKPEAGGEAKMWVVREGI